MRAGICPIKPSKDIMKKKFSLLALILCLVIAFTAVALVACNPDNTSESGDGTTIEATEGLLISNSDFKVISTSGNWPRSITGWSGAKTYSSSSIPDDVISGAVSLDPTLYNDNKSAWKDDGALYETLRTHYSSDANAVNNVMMIYMPTKDQAGKDDDYGPTAYGYTSQSFTLDKASYYKLTVDVLTYNIAGTDEEDNVPGASIYVSSNAYAEFSGIDTKGEWKTYEIYFESAPTASTSLTLRLSLGKYSAYYNDGLTTGYAFFDNVNLVKLEDTDSQSAAAQFAAKADEELKGTNDALQTVTLKVPNGRFDFGSTSVGTVAPSNWTLVTGTDAPTSYRYNGIIDAAKFEDNYKSYSGTYYMNGASHTPAQSYLTTVADNIGTDLTLGTNVYMLSQQMMTAQGIKTAKSITIEKNKFYAISVNVLTAHVYGEGVSLILSGDGKEIAIKGISQNKVPDTVLFGQNAAGSASTNTWRTYTFYIQGNSYRDMTYNLTLWLGTGNATDNTEVTYTHYSSTSDTSGTSRTTYLADGTFASGWAFFDNVTLKEFADQGAFDTAWKEAGASQSAEIDGEEARALVYSLDTDNLFTTDGAVTGSTGISGDFSQVTKLNDSYDNSTLGTPAGFDKALGDTAVSGEYVTAGVVTLNDDAIFATLGIDAPLTPYNLGDGAKGLMINATQNTYFGYKTSEFSVAPNHFYRISLWVKTADVKSTSGIYVYLMQPAEKEGDDDKELASFTAINTADYDEYTNDWAELTFVVRGNADKTEKAYLKIAFGADNAYNSDTLANGTAFVSNMSMTAITYSAFSSTTTGTYVKSVNLADSKSASFTNGGFDTLDYAEMGDEAWSADNTADGTLQNSNKAGVPDGWTLSDTTLLDEDKAESANFVGGVVKFSTAEAGGWTTDGQISNLFGADASFFDTNNGAPNMLVLAGKNGAKYNAGYLSDSFTLSASTNYRITVNAKVESGTKAMIFLQGEASGTEVNGYDRYFEINGDGTWHTYTFDVQVGLTSVSLKLGLWLGENADVTGNTADKDALASTGIALFDMVTKSTLTDKEFNAATSGDELRKITFFTDSFDSMSGESSDDAIVTPDGWSSTVGTEQDRNDTTSGVFDIDKAEEDEGYIVGLGPELTADSFTVTDSELTAAKEDPAYAGMTDDAIVAALKEKKLEAAKEQRLISLSDIKAGYDGKSFLVINNKADSAFYYASSGYTLTAETAYKITVKVFTYGIGHVDENGNFTAADDKGAYIELYLGSSNDADSPMRFADVQSSDGWATYTFYVLAPENDVTSVAVRLGLGLYDADDASELVSGYAFFDAVSIEKIGDIDAYEQAIEGTEDNEFVLSRAVPEKASEGETGTDNEEAATPDNKFDLVNLSWMIPTILMALAVIAVVITFFVKKYKKKMTKGKSSDAPADSTSQNNINKKKGDYDSFNE